MVRRVSVVIALSAVTLAGCTTQAPDDAPPTSTRGSLDGAAGTPSTSTTSTTPPVAIEMTPAADSTDARPDRPVVIKASGGTLTKATVTGPDNEPVPGVLKGGVWTSTARLAPATRYTVVTTSTRVDGSPQEDTQTFATLRPAVVATYTLLYGGQTVGVGAPVTIQFDSPVQTKAMRAAIEKNAHVTTTPSVEGSWGWLDNRQLMWRPKTFWASGTKVSLKADIRGLQTGDSKWIGRSGESSFRIGDAMISTVAIDKHTMTVTRNGNVLKTLPVSAGKGGDPRFVTRSGTKVIIAKAGDLTMDSETVGIKKGDPDYYKVETKDNLRVTWTGEFLHSAPWSVGSQGSANVSHGCVNLAPDAAKWMFENSRVGDVVKFTGSDRPFKPTEGIGVWQYSYAQWVKQSALTP